MPWQHGTRQQGWYISKTLRFEKTISDPHYSVHFVSFFSSKIVGKAAFTCDSPDPPQPFAITVSWLCDLHGLVGVGDEVVQELWHVEAAEVGTKVVAHPHQNVGATQVESLLIVVGPLGDGNMVK